MLKNKTRSYKILFFIFLFFVLIKIAALGVSAGCFISYFRKLTESNTISIITIITLLADFIANLAIWGINRGIRLINKPGAYVLLLSPILLCGIMVMSVIIVAYESGSTEAVRMEYISWAITTVYLLLPDVLLAFNLAHIKRRLAEADKPRKLTTGERIRKAKK